MRDIITCDCGYRNRSKDGPACKGCGEPLLQAERPSGRAGPALPPARGSVPEPRQLRGLEKLCKLYGRMKCGDVMMVWDYTREEAVPEREMLDDRERWSASEKIKWSLRGGGISAPNAKLTCSEPAGGASTRTEETGG